jgi:hypothetical protein
MVIVSGGIKVDGEKIVLGIKDGVGREIPLFGGLAADDYKMNRTVAFSNGFLSDGGLCALIIDTDKIEMQGLATSGWQPFGLVKTITGSVGNVLYSINDEPALDVFLRQFGFNEDSTKTERDQLLNTQTNYPLQIIQEDGSSILRTPLVIDESNKSLILAGGVVEGAKFRFSTSPGFEVIEQTIQEFGQLKKNKPEIDAAILFSCKARHGAFGPLLEEEIEGIYGYWKKPMVGFLCYGEIGNTKNGTCEFHNETCSMVLLKEK